MNRRRAALIACVMGCVLVVAWRSHSRRVWVQETAMLQKPFVKFRVLGDHATLSVSFGEDVSWLRQLRESLEHRTDDTPVTLVTDLALRWPLAVGEYKLDGRYVLRINDEWSFHPGPLLAPAVESFNMEISCFCLTRPDWHVDQVLTGTVRIAEVSDHSVRGTLHVTSTGALEAFVATDFEAAWKVSAATNQAY